MKKVETLRKAIESVSGKIEELEAKQKEQVLKSTEDERKIHDVRMDVALGLINEEEGDKRIERLRKDAEKSSQALQDTSEKLEALKAARVSRIDKVREDAADDVRKEREKYLRTKDALFADIKEMQYLIYEKLEQAKKERETYLNKVHDFCTVSQTIDLRYASGDFKVSEQLPPYFAQEFLTDYRSCEDLYKQGIQPESYKKYLIDGKVR